jgi:hypothetical protein
MHGGSNLCAGRHHYGRCLAAWPQRSKGIHHDVGDENLLAFAQNFGGYSWSADGGWLAVSAVAEGRQWIYVLRADGAGLRRLPAAGSGLGYLTGPLWRKKSRFVEPPSWVHIPVRTPGNATIRAGEASVVLPPGKCVRHVGPRMEVQDCSMPGRH